MKTFPLLHCAPCRHAHFVVRRRADVASQTRIVLSVCATLDALVFFSTLSSLDVFIIIVTIQYMEKSRGLINYKISRWFDKTIIDSKIYFNAPSFCSKYLI